VILLVVPDGECSNEPPRSGCDRSPVALDTLYLEVAKALGVSSKNLPGKLNLAPLRPRAAPIAPMGRHNRSGGQIFNGIVFGGDVGTIYTIFPLQSMHCEP